MTKRYLPFVAVVLAVLVATSVGAIADGDSSNPPGEGVPQIETIEAEALLAMAVLRAPRGSGDALPSDIAARMDTHAEFGMNPSLSRLSIGNATNALYVIPANGHVCASLTVGEGANVICPTTEDVADGNAAPATVTVATGDIGIYGLVPDGVEAVSVRTGGSGSLDVETAGNGYFTVLEAGTPLESVSYAGPAGTVEFPIYDPRRAFEDAG